MIPTEIFLIVVFSSFVNHVDLERFLTIHLDKILEKDVLKGKITSEERDGTMSLIQKLDSFDEFKSCQFIIEAVKENLEIKQQLFRQLSELVYTNSPTEFETILATNTSSISVTKIATSSKRPDRVIGMHFMNPVPVMKLVEVIQGLETSNETMDLTLALASEMKKTTTIAKDTPGFIANRCLMPYINEAIFALSEVSLHSHHICWISMCLGRWEQIRY